MFQCLLRTPELIHIIYYIIVDIRIFHDLSKLFRLFANSNWLCFFQLKLIETISDFFRIRLIETIRDL